MNSGTTIPRNNRSDCDRYPSWIVESVPVKESCWSGLVLDRLDPLDRWRSSVEKSPTESVLVDLDLFCVRVMDPSWTRFGPLKVLFCWKSLTRLGLILDSCFNRWKRPPNILDRWTRPARLWPLGLVLDRWNCRLVEESYCRLGPLRVPDRYQRLLHLHVFFFFWIGPLKVSDWWKSPTCWQRLSYWKRPTCWIAESVLLVLDSCWTLGPLGSLKESQWTSLFRLRQLKASALPKRLDC